MKQRMGVAICRKLVVRGKRGTVMTTLPVEPTKRRFVLRVNANTTWTPELVNASGTHTSADVARVIINVTGSNDQQVASLAGLWANLNVPVTIVFPRSVVKPVVSNEDFPETFTVGIARAFKKVDGIWQATKTLKREVMKFFAEDHLVTVSVK